MDTLECASCRQHLPREAFSNSQFKKRAKSKVRCKACIASEEDAQLGAVIKGGPAVDREGEIPVLPHSMARLLVSFGMSNEMLASYYCGVIDEQGKRRPVVVDSMLAECRKEIEFITDEVKALGKGNILSMRRSEWNSNVWAYPDVEGKLMLCVNYSAANEVIIQPGNGAFPSLEQLRTATANAHVLSAVCLKNAPWQIPLAEDSISNPHFSERTYFS
jgi:hypothetical protein